VKSVLLLLAMTVLVSAQNASSDIWTRAGQVLEWRAAIEVSPAQAAPSSAGRELVYRVHPGSTNADEWRKAIETASRLGAKTLIGTFSHQDAAAVMKLANERGIELALDTAQGDLVKPERALARVKAYGSKVKVWADVPAWERSGTQPMAAIYMLREHLAGATLGAGKLVEEFLREAYRLDIKPLLWTYPADDKQVAATIEALVSYHQSYASRTRGIRRLGGVSPEERVKLEAAIPSTAPVPPKKPRRLLVFDLNVGRFGHPSIPYANLAMELMGQKTGAFTATDTSDPAMLEPNRLLEFDAVYLNNTIGDIFSTAEARDAFATFVANGGGLIGNHATTVTATEWEEFGNILGARGASHRMTDENVVINVEDPDNPITAAFAPGPFEYADEIFRFQPPYSRDNVRVLLSVDPVKTDMNQGRCYGQCYRDDNDYPIAWIQKYGKGRVFYTTLGHNPHVFWQPNMLKMFLAAVQYALGDLDVDATPRRGPNPLDRVLQDLADYDWGKDEAPVRRLEMALGMLPPGPDASRDAEQKLLSALRGRLKLGAIDAITRQLAVVGGSASVASLESLLSDSKTADMARYALERIDDPGATDALRRALRAATDARIQAGLIHSVARRKDAPSVSALKELLSSPQPQLVEAAANALGMIGNEEAEQALLSASLNATTAHALLTLAEAAPAERAKAIYLNLNSVERDDQVRVAAIQGLARLGDTTAVSNVLGEPAPSLQAASVAALAGSAPSTLLAAMNKLAPAIHIQALHALAATGNSSARQAALEAAQGGDPALRAAGLRILGEVGIAEDVPRLVNAAVGTSPDEQAVARFALSRMNAAGVDAALVHALASSKGKAKVTLIQIVGERGIDSAQPALIASARDADSEVRRLSLKALSSVAKPDRTTELLQLLLECEEDDRADAALALAAAVSRSAKPDLQPLLRTLESTTASASRASLLSALALTGDPGALPVLRKHLDSGDSTTMRATIAGLANWPSPEPLDDLLRVAGGAVDPTLKVLALRGYLGLLQRPANRTSAETAKLLGNAMAVAARPEDKKTVLAALQRVTAPESLRIAEEATRDPAVAEEARLAAATLEKALAARQR
jgi:type 1 glutamine amidotransferase/HEAT repeat protein